MKMQQRTSIQNNLLVRLLWYVYYEIAQFSWGKRLFVYKCSWFKLRYPNVLYVYYSEQANAMNIQFT